MVVAGAVARRIDYGGHVWALLHWALGFRRIGWSVLVLDRLDAEPELRGSERVRRFVEEMRRFGLEDAYSLELGPDEPPVGLARAEVARRVGGADLLVNVMGYLQDEELLARARRRVFLDVDPGFGQMWRALGLCDLFAGHDAFVTVGTRLGQPGCRVPTCGARWVPTLPPVALDLWAPVADPGPRFTSVGAWRGAWAPVEFEGETYGLRVHEFRRFATVPSASGLPFEAALDLDPADGADARLLCAGGWQLSDPRAVSGTSDAYRGFVQRSRAEFTVAKGMYVRTASGWVSDRTACYLASGRPALVQDTGVQGPFETGVGLVTFREPDEAVAYARDVDADWRRHARAARDLAVEHFDARRVLGRMVEQVAA